MMAYWLGAIDRQREEMEQVEYLSLKVKFSFAESSSVRNAETSPRSVWWPRSNSRLGKQISKY